VIRVPKDIKKGSPEKTIKETNQARHKNVCSLLKCWLEDMLQGQEKMASFYNGGSHPGTPERSVLTSVLFSTLIIICKRG